MEGMYLLINFLVICLFVYLIYPSAEFETDLFAYAFIHLLIHFFTEMCSVVHACILVHLFECFTLNWFNSIHEILFCVISFHVIVISFHVIHHWKLTWHWKIPIFNRTYNNSFTVDFPASHDSFQGCTSKSIFPVNFWGPIVFGYSVIVTSYPCHCHIMSGNILD